MAIELVEAAPAATTPTLTPDPVASAQAAAASTVATTTWRDGLPEELKANPSLVDFKDVSGLAKAFVDTKAMVGKKTEGLVKPPATDAKPEEITAWRKALGVPEKPDGYTATLPEGLGADPETLAIFQKIAHDNHLTPGQFQKLVQFDLDRHQRMTERQRESAKTAESTLRKEWGGAYDHKLAILQRHVEEVGGKELVEDLELRGKGASLPLLKYLDKIATEYVASGKTPGIPVSPITSQDAERRIAEIRSDPAWMDDFKYPEKHAELVKEYGKLIHLRK